MSVSNAEFILLWQAYGLSCYVQTRMCAAGGDSDYPWKQEAVCPSAAL